MNSLLELVTWEPNVKMQYELVLMLLLFLLPAVRVKSGQRLAAVWTVVFSGFLLLHRALLPFIVSGIYLYALCGVLYALYQGSAAAFLLPAQNFLLAVRNIAGESGQDMSGSSQQKPGQSRKWSRIQSLEQSQNQSQNRSERLLLAVILTVLLIQLCRINIAVDYDSLRYGLRSPYVLLGGKGLSGFFENPGLVNTVYTYSKGFELLTLPLSFFRSYAFLLCFNVWILIGVLVLTGALVRKLTGIPASGTLAAFFCALMPGITNMAVTAKSDLLTLFCQLIFVYAVVSFIQENLDIQVRGMGLKGTSAEKSPRRFVGIGLAGLLASYALKPTSMLFSSALGISALFYLLWLRRRFAFSGLSGEKEQENKEKEQRNEGGRRKNQCVIPVLTAASLRILFLSILFVGVCWLRTFLITGIPVTSVFSGVFTALGLKLRYPFGVQSVPDGSTAQSFLDGIELLFKRLFGFLFCPAGADMEHVRMAWGGAAFVFLLLFFCVFAGRIMRRIETEAARSRIRRAASLSEQDLTETTVFMYRAVILFFGVTALLSVLSLHFLYQVDGNYYMLLYVLTGIAGTAGLLYLWGDTKFRPGQTVQFALLAAFMLYVTAFTGWAGAVGFTELPRKADLQEDGISGFLYYDHIKTAEERHRREGNFRLWQSLSSEAQGAENHVIAFMQEPDCYDLRCIAESYTDIAGSGGNVYLVKKLNIFKEYLAWSGTDFIYADKDWLARPGNERAKELLEDLIEDGTLTELVYEEDLEAQDAAVPGEAEPLASINSAAEASAPLTGTEAEPSGENVRNRRYFYGKIDKARVQEKWEVPLSEEAAAKAEREMQKYAEQ